ncbi:zinc finger MYM-type protein 1-like [Hydra vulgaris]|uniref:zinc finger MYM-type protein 1-like n=1 Tax=Hydra vulgaris TaxID=6087 RepID=UPI0032EA206F
MDDNNHEFSNESKKRTLSGAATRKLAKKVRLNMDATVTTAVNTLVSEDQHLSKSVHTESSETDTPAESFQHCFEQTNNNEAFNEKELTPYIPILVTTVQEPLLPQSEFPSDPGLYNNTSLSAKLIRKLCEIGPCQPGLQKSFRFPTDEAGRKFQTSWYTKTIGKGSIKKERNWLVFSPSNQKMYCHASWLFADFKAENYSKEWSDTSAGVYKWKKGMEKIVEHETSHQHQNAIRQYLLTKYRISNDKTVISGLISQECRQVEKNREVLKRMIDVTLFLAKQGLSFRGHREHQHFKIGNKGTANNAGNFLELYEKRNQLYLSHDVQNDLIQSLASEISSTINNEVKLAQFFSLIIDSTIDISKIDQMSVSLRMVLKSGNVVERFIGFYTLENSNAEAFAELILSELEKRNIDIKLCRGQAYDGASVMSGIKSGLQTRIKAFSPNAIYVHCCAHVLNLVTIEAMSVNSEVQLFFGTTEKLYTYLTSSLPRLHILQEHQKRLYESTVDTLKRLSDTRWASRKHAVDAVVESFSAILATLEDINLGESKQHTGDVRAEAIGLSVLIKKHSFVFLMIFLQKLLNNLFVLSNYLQRKDIDVLFAKQLIDVTKKNLSI